GGLLHGEDGIENDPHHADDVRRESVLKMSVIAIAKAAATSHSAPVIPSPFIVRGCVTESPPTSLPSSSEVRGSNTSTCTCRRPPGPARPPPSNGPVRGRKELGRSTR